MLLRGETGYNTTALIELVQVQGAHGKNSPPAKTNGTSKAITSHQLVMFLAFFFHWMYKMKFSCYQESSVIHD